MIQLIIVIISYLIIGKLHFDLLQKNKSLITQVTLLHKQINKIDDNQIKSDENTHRENFIKFLSDSRDSAYEYIELVQDKLNKFVLDVDSEIKHFDEYGEVLSTTRPDYQSMVKISKAYKELKTLLPEEEK